MNPGTSNAGLETGMVVVGDNWTWSINGRSDEEQVEKRHQCKRKNDGKAIKPAEAKLGICPFSENLKPWFLAFTHS